ncbi:MAG: polyketide cyclase [Nitrosomonadaceae bacterium]|nr:polyketide cyclase [Nitrosomonadaceae bacterium]|tara:strand:- start:65 stop:565 length:501 start_codon:yes stop_codon:yes gene_type:complete
MFSLNKDTPVVGKAEIKIESPCKHVFSFVGTDFIKNYPKWSPEVVELQLLTTGPVKVGTMCRQIRIDQGRRSESTFKVTIFQPGKRICFEGVSNPYKCDYAIKSDKPQSESNISFTFELLSLELFMRPFEKLIRAAVQDGTEKTVRNIKKLIESENDVYKTNNHSN